MLTISQTDDSNGAYRIAQKLGGSYFDQRGLKQIKKDTKEHKLFGAFDNQELIGFITYKKVNPEVVEMT